MAGALAHAALVIVLIELSYSSVAVLNGDCPPAINPELAVDPAHAPACRPVVIAAIVVQLDPSHFKHVVLLGAPPATIKSEESVPKP